MRSLLLAALLAAPASAQESAAFLKIGVGARAIGMGGAYTALADDISAMNWNPGGLAGLKTREFGLTHAELIAGTRYDFLGYAQPTRYGTFGAGAAYLGQGAIEGRDSTGKLTGNFGASDSAVNPSFASGLMGMKLGGNVKYIQSRIAEASGRTFALDAGAQYSLGSGLPSLGVAVMNLGPGMKFLNETSPLPLTLAVGASYRLPVGLVAALDVKQRPYAHASEVSVGTEYAMFSTFALRAGYASNNRAANGASGVGKLSGLAAGFGIKMYGYTLDYSMTPFGELGNVQRFSLGARF